MLIEVLGFVNLLCAGILAGEEFVVRYGIRGPIASIHPEPQIQLRQALIRRLRVLVPAIFSVALISGIAVTLLERLRPALDFRCAGLLALFVFISITLAGTVPINQAILTWKTAEPPEGWQAMIKQMGTARHSADLGGDHSVRPLPRSCSAARRP
ncbi:hypothetical protein RBB77_23000 [Tunturibacter psychrotolerans]|uniref:DUF1772 domain-containing protein n=1 Tax=Tunturiibacter psychrotolerans TaxID=3069686 RepID=A0AAU7ZQQ4_9BACT